MSPPNDSLSPLRLLRRTPMARATTAITATLLMSIVPACNSGAPDPSSSGTNGLTANDGTAPVREGGQMTIGLAAETLSWSPFTGQWSSSSHFVANALFDPLAAIASDGTTKPYLAEAITSSPDFLAWTIRLRRDVTFTNGEPLDATALKGHLDSARTTGLTAQTLGTIAAVELIDALTVTVKMSQPWSTFSMALTGQPGYVAAPAMINDPQGAKNPIGTGPFQLTEWLPGESLKAKKNPRYWQKGLPHIDAVQFNVIADDQTRSVELQSGVQDVIEVKTASELARFTNDAKSGAYRMTTNLGAETDEIMIALNTTVEPFNDPIARQALATGLDQDELSQSNFQGALPGARGPFSPSSPYYLSPSDAGYPAFDPTKAKDLARQYQEKHGKPISFTALVPPDLAYLSAAQSLKEQANASGIEVEIEGIEQPRLIARLVGGDFQASGFVLFNAPTLDRAYPFIATKPVTDGISLNFTRNDNPRIAAAMNAARSTADQKQQIDAYRTVQREMAADLDKIFLVHSISAVVSDNRVNGLDATTFPGTTQPAYAGTSAMTGFLAGAWLT